MLVSDDPSFLKPDKNYYHVQSGCNLSDKRNEPQCSMDIPHLFQTYHSKFYHFQGCELDKVLQKKVLEIVNFVWKII